jgi:hypothetical protein
MAAAQLMELKRAGAFMQFNAEIVDLGGSNAIQKGNIRKSERATS